MKVLNGGKPVPDDWVEESDKIDWLPLGIACAVGIAIPWLVLWLL